ncbi:BREX-1 system adenine-specific DNA-methyltransferase PglX [Agrobacterium pusense]|uniref:BREX-1 system adenine-specific DNA-methyltransferase PglX n=1 Tax=Agrobacterium pusense TaxID=648995 RepID=UPI00289D5F12|nr:BREX-1 system adenine-specific DNA-methyltransferase PglX [Agrobacterium pusense]
MDTSKLKKFAPEARRTLMSQVASKLKAVLAEESAARRESPQAVKELQGRVATYGEDQVIEQVAYTWFNRFSALRFMDANGYNSMGIVTPAEGQTRPEILAEAVAGHIDEEIPSATRQQVAALLDGRALSRDPQAEAYRLLVVAVCNQWHRAMPFLFEKIADYTELLMPEDLLSADSVLARMREVMTADACRDVEIIGWLYQFYISEKKDEVFAGLKKSKKITAENIPAATQLFTPHWIVRYLVENSLGRLWMLNRPNSNLIERMDYFIKPDQPENDFPRISSPEEIRVCDPACGSGHMLTYAFDLLYMIYEEEGYDASDIPEKILTNNLFGIELDERAGALASFALTMKARAVQRRFFRRDVQPAICVLKNVTFADGELREFTKSIGHDVSIAQLTATLKQFSEADTLGSLIAPSLEEPGDTARKIDAGNLGDSLFLRDTHARVQAVLKMASFLGSSYHVVVANPPYMGSNGMNATLNTFAKLSYPDSKSDLFAMFMERAVAMTRPGGMTAMINMQSWMFLGTFSLLRSKMLRKTTLLCMAHIGERGFDTIGGAVVSTTAFILKNAYNPNENGVYIRLVSGKSESEKAGLALAAIGDAACAWRYSASSSDFEKIPGNPIAYWAKKKSIDVFASLEKVGDRAVKGLDTNGNIDTFVRLWHEVSLNSSSLNQKHEVKWYPLAKGGKFRRWYGNHDYLINFENNGRDLKANNANLRSRERYFSDGLTWSVISTDGFAVRRLPPASLFDQAGSAIHLNEYDKLSLDGILATLNTKFVEEISQQISPTISFTTGDIRKFPIWENSNTVCLSQRCQDISKSDWNSYETSWNFDSHPLVSGIYRHLPLADAYVQLRGLWRTMTEEMWRLEEENNKIFISAFNLADDLTPEVPLEKISLTCNPAYRYGSSKPEAELEELLRAETMREFISYAVGCMFGRYSLDLPGLILANQGDGIADYLAKVANPAYTPDVDNVIPVLDGDWFADDITERFRKFLRVALGEERFTDNLAFIEGALGKDIRRYFTRDFYNDHVKRYKKRPIYWMFSSPRGTFNALIYMHRYRPDTVSVVLNGYLREYRNKLEAERRKQEALTISSNATQSEKTTALKEIQKLGPMIEELDEYERETLFPLATQKIEIDLDDGVKANYPRFGAALKPIKGLADVEEE